MIIDDKAHIKVSRLVKLSLKLVLKDQYEPVMDEMFLDFIEMMKRKIAKINASETNKYYRSFSKSYSLSSSGVKVKLKGWVMMRGWSTSSVSSSNFEPRLTGISVVLSPFTGYDHEPIAKKIDDTVMKTIEREIFKG